MVILTNKEILDELKKIGITTDPELALILVEYKRDFAHVYSSKQKNIPAVRRMLVNIITGVSRLLRNKVRFMNN